ncbi:MAG: exo-alpha-sialidase [Clostridia bacterium]|nr:exo-alpha-sialidase [Clostridia bacterium]
MKLFAKFTTLLLAIAVLPLSLFSCSTAPAPSAPADQSQDAAPITVTEEYLITCPSGDKVASRLARSIKYALRDELGMTLTLKEDFLIDPSQIPEKEILVGETDREESVKAYESLGENQWSVTAENGKIVIAGKGTIALKDAIQHFISTYISGKTAVNVEANMAHHSESPFYSFSWSDGELIDTGVKDGGYPRLYSLKDGTLLLGCDGMTVYRSTDYGMTWEKPVHASQKQKGTANAAFIQTEDGTVYLGFRSTYHNADGSFYSSIQVSYSTDNGRTWKKHSTVYENTEADGRYNGVWEPHFGMMNGKLTCFYANDSSNVTTYQNIEYKQWDPEAGEWTNRTIVCNGEDHKSRDGMPVWQQLSTGEYVCVIEAWNKDDNDRFAIQLTYSEDGVEWSKPVTVMRPLKTGTVCAAPYIVELPNGQLVISCQTNERNEEGNDTLYMGTVISDGTPVSLLTEKNFSAHDYPYYDQPTTTSYMWNGMYVYGYYLFACATGPNGIRLNRIDFTKND